MQDVKQKGRKAKHLEYYVGPVRITKKIGDRINKEQLFQREAGMLIMKKELNDLSIREVEVLPLKHVAEGCPGKGKWSS